MKKSLILIAALLSFTALATVASARTAAVANSPVEVDASLVLASGPASGFDTTLGITFGAGMMLPQIDRNLQGRVELSYFSWSDSVFGVDVSYTRVPIAVAGRYFIPFQGSGKVKVYAQGGLELSFDKAEAAVSTIVPGFPPRTVTAKASESEVHFGIVPGIGISVPINPQLSFDADARIHIITDSYYTLQGGIAYHF